MSKRALVHSTCFLDILTFVKPYLPLIVSIRKEWNITNLQSLREQMGIDPFFIWIYVHLFIGSRINQKRSIASLEYRQLGENETWPVMLWAFTVSICDWVKLSIPISFFYFNFRTIEISSKNYRGLYNSRCRKWRFKHESKNYRGFYNSRSRKWQFNLYLTHQKS